MSQPGMYIGCLPLSLSNVEMFAGKYMDKSMVAAIGMGNMIQTFCVIAVYTGFNASIEIIVS